MMKYKQKESTLPADVVAHVRVVGIANRAFGDFVAKCFQRGLKGREPQSYISEIFFGFLHGPLLNGSKDFHERGINGANQLGDVSGIVLSHLSEFAWKGLLDVAFREFARHRSGKGLLSCHSRS